MKFQAIGKYAFGWLWIALLSPCVFAQYDDEDRAPRGQALHRHVELVRDRREVNLQGSGQEVSEAVKLLGNPDQVVVHIPEIDCALRADEREVVARELVKDFPLWPDGAPNMN